MLETPDVYIYVRKNRQNGFVGQICRTENLFMLQLILIKHARKIGGSLGEDAA